MVDVLDPVIAEWYRSVWPPLLLYPPQVGGTKRNWLTGARHCLNACRSPALVQRSKKWLVRGLVKFATAVARLVCPDLLG